MRILKEMDLVAAVLSLTRLHVGVAVEPPHQHARAALHRPRDDEGRQASEGCVGQAQAGGVGRHGDTADAHSGVDCRTCLAAVPAIVVVVVIAMAVKVVGIEEVPSWTDDTLTPLDGQLVPGVGR